MEVRIVSLLKAGAVTQYGAMETSLNNRRLLVVPDLAQRGRRVAAGGSLFPASP